MADKLPTCDELYDMLMKKVAPLPCQETYARALATIFSMHLRKNALMDVGFDPEALPNVSAIVVAPSGQGKTFLMKQMAQLAGVNTVGIDASALAREGWKGMALSQQLFAAKKTASDPDAFFRSVIFFDEIDKLAEPTGEPGNAQPNILQLFNGGSILVEDVNREVEPIDVGRFTMIMAGAFTGLDAIIEKRMKPETAIGFGHMRAPQKLSKAERLQQATLADLEKYGLMRELLGRVGSIISIEPMGVEDYRQLLTAQNGSVREKYNNYLLSMYGVTFDITEMGVQAIANRCMRSEAGARAVNPLVDDLMRKAIAEVERNSSVQGVLLDAAGGEIHMRYSDGTRVYTPFFRESSLDVHSPYVLEAGSILVIAEKLCAFYEKAGGDPAVKEELIAFLKCSLCYMKDCLPPIEFSFSTLEKLVCTLRRYPYGKDTYLDLIVRCSIENHNASQLQPFYYEAFRKRYTKDTAQHLFAALNTIMQYVRTEELGTNIQLRLVRGEMEE